MRSYTVATTDKKNRSQLCIFRLRLPKRSHTLPLKRLQHLDDTCRIICLRMNFIPLRYVNRGKHIKHWRGYQAHTWSRTFLNTGDPVKDSVTSK